VAAEVRRLGLETTKAKGVQAGKGARVNEGLVALRALGQLVDCGNGEGKKNKEKTRKV